MFQANYNVCQDCGQPLIEKVPYGDTVASAPIDCDCPPDGSEYAVFATDVSLPIASEGVVDEVDLYVFVNDDTQKMDFHAAVDWQGEPEADDLVDSLRYFFPDCDDATFGIIEAALSEIAERPVDLIEVDYRTAINAI